MAHIKIGKPAPDTILKTVEGDSILLGSLWQTGQPTLIIFLRHLA